MDKIKVNGKYHFEFENSKGRITKEGVEITADYKSSSSNIAHVLYQNKSYRVEVVEHFKAGKTVLLKVNSREYRVELTDQYDELLHQLGMDMITSSKVAELKAPMPGLVLNVMVREGDEVSKGDNIIILEAMKMENIIKSPVDGVIKNIRVKTGDKLEKNQVMIDFA
jgi:biotin carboxyl carrier protein